jgi:hypothetical protein
MILITWTEIFTGICSSVPGNYFSAAISQISAELPPGKLAVGQRPASGEEGLRNTGDRHTPNPNYTTQANQAGQPDY